MSPPRAPLISPPGGAQTAPALTRRASTPQCAGVAQGLNVCAVRASCQVTVCTIAAARCRSPADQARAAPARDAGEAATFGGMTQRTGIEVTFLGAAGEVTGSCYRVDCRWRAVPRRMRHVPGRPRCRRQERRGARFRRPRPRLRRHHARAHRSFRAAAAARRARLSRARLRDAGDDRPPRRDAAGQRAHPRNGICAGARASSRATRGRRTRVPASRRTLAAIRSRRRCTRSPMRERSLSLLVPVAYDRLFEPKASIRFRFRDAGHILGSSIVELWADIDGGDAQARLLRRSRPARTAGDGRSDADRRCRRRHRRVHLRQPAAQDAGDDLRRARAGAGGHASARQRDHPRVRRRPDAGSAARAGRPRAAGPGARAQHLRRFAARHARDRDHGQVRRDPGSRKPRPRAAGSRATRTRSASASPRRRRIRWRSTA